jgi:hypothetical protein
MGKVLLSMYDEAKKIGGLSAQIKLAVQTKMPSSKAAELPDSPENLSLFKATLDQIKKEFTDYQKN